MAEPISTSIAIIATKELILKEVLEKLTIKEVIDLIMKLADKVDHELIMQSIDTIKSTSLDSLQAQNEAIRASINNFQNSQFTENFEQCSVKETIKGSETNECLKETEVIKNQNLSSADVYETDFNTRTAKETSDDALQKKLEKQEIEPKETAQKEATNNIEKVQCRNQELAGKRHPDTGVEFEKKIINVDGKLKEVVAPKFESRYDVYLDKELINASDPKQFDYCNKELTKAIENDESLKIKFSKDQLEQIKNGDIPDNFVWHHDAEVGKMQLLDSKIHQMTGHDGGRKFWGGGTNFR